MSKTVEICYINTSNLDANTKCAEIFYCTSTFSITCVECRLLYTDYEKFVQHYRGQHVGADQTPDNKDTSADSTSLKNETKSRVSDPIKTQHEVLMQQQDQWMLSCLVEANEDDEEELRKYGESLDYMNVEDATEQSISLLECEDYLGDNTKSSNNLEDIPSNELNWSLTYTPQLLNNIHKRPYKPRNQPNRCNYCGKTFRRRYQLDTHLNIHTGLKPHQCDVCGRQFRAINTLQRHLNTHGERETFHCKHCAKEFAHRAAYVSHVSRHTQERQVPCNECDKLFYTPNQLDTHKRKMHNVLDDILPHACDLCAKRYRSASMLSTHKFKKHYRTAKFACEQCGKKFVEQEQLDTHRNIHVIKDDIT